MEIKYKEIVLRDMVESDIEDEIRWNTVQTEWALWDAPWEMEIRLPEFRPEEFRAKELEALKEPLEEPRWSLELDTAEGVHIGSVNTYLIDENYEWIKRMDVQEGQKVFYALGIEINEAAYWNKGLGTQALAAFIQYHLQNGHSQLCVQTWSGNLRMIRCAEKLGFEECKRVAGKRQVRGGTYDGLTFQLNAEQFQRYLNG